jgi:crotonobetainyl-CoA:carnitine CoA-transferase CaiB-like acyl-CoA transferase
MHGNIMKKRRRSGGTKTERSMRAMRMDKVDEELTTTIMRMIARTLEMMRSTMSRGDIITAMTAIMTMRMIIIKRTTTIEGMVIDKKHYEF